MSPAVDSAEYLGRGRGLGFDHSNASDVDVIEAFLGYTGLSKPAALGTEAVRGLAQPPATRHCRPS
jgi:hypothetical protein